MAIKKEYTEMNLDFKPEPFIREMMLIPKQGLSSALLLRQTAMSFLMIPASLIGAMQAKIYILATAVLISNTYRKSSPL